MVGTDYRFVEPFPRAVARSRGAFRIRSQRQDGAISIMFVGVFLVILGFCGLALDLSQVYNRKAEMQSVADAVASAAARRLNGTAEGIDSALDAAEKTASALSYKYYGEPIEWSRSAIKFGSGPDGGAGGWLDATAAKGAAPGILFAKVDTRDLDPRHGSVKTVFMHVLSPSLAHAGANSRAIAGRSSINVTPLAVCALDTEPALPRGNELVEFGFRRGVSYDLMRLNPNGTVPENFLVNPVAPPGTLGSSVMTRMDIVRPFVCTGTMAVPKLSGGQITVERFFPLDSLYLQLNSRFGTYTAPCTASTAPPDANVKEYYRTGSVPWMTTEPDDQTAAEWTDGGTKLLTIAERKPTSPGSPAGTDYGPLWTFAKAVRYSSYTPGAPEPASGYATFNHGDWPALYTPGEPTAKPSYPASGPYSAISGTNFQAPPSVGYKGVRKRRVLNVPLLACPVAPGSRVTADVLAVAKFFMTVPATSTKLSAEFAGLAPEASLSGQVELYP